MHFPWRATQIGKSRKLANGKVKTFKEYIHKELHVVSEGMSMSMKKTFIIVNIARGAYHDITNAIIAPEYAVNMNAA